jgi:hypothetical protein
MKICVEMAGRRISRQHTDIYRAVRQTVEYGRLPNIYTVHVARIAKKNVYRFLVEKPEEKKPLGRPRRGWEEILKRIL